MTGSILKLSEVKRALQKEKLNFKILNDTDNSVIFLDEPTKAKLRGKIVRSFNEGEVYHWPTLNQENIDKLIDILCVRDDLYIYLTIYHDISLKNIIRDQDFVYEPRCFDRKRSYAKGIFSGLSYLHEKSLSLMNLCDDNVIISRADDRAIITNFDYLICERQTTRSRLNVPEMYMAPETEEGEFDPIKAEIWASGALMLDMFLAHMVPWPSEPKRMLKILDNVSLDLLQAANAGSVVSAVDLERFKIFLKRFFRQNPQERIPVKYASIASFLQYRSQYKMHRDSHPSTSFPENALSFDSYNLNLTTCYNPRYKTDSNLMLQIAQKGKEERTDILPDALTIETQQAGRSLQYGENETKADTFHTGPLSKNIEQENSTKSTLLPSCKTLVSITDAGTIDDFQKISKSWEEVNENMRAEVESSSNCYQSKSLTFIKPRNDPSTIEFENISNCYSNNNKPSSSKQSVCELPSSDMGLNLLYSINDGDDFKNDPDERKDCDNSNNKSGCEEEEIGKKVRETVKTRQLLCETQIKQRIPCKQTFHTSIQTFGRCVAKPERISNTPHIFLSPEIESVINKIAFLRRCYLSIQAHQNVFISNEFAIRQIKFIKDYRNFLYFEDLRLREKLIKKYKLKSEDVTKLMKYVDSGIFSRGYHYKKLSMTRNFPDITRSNFRQSQKMDDTTRDNVKYFHVDESNGTDNLAIKPDRNRSYHKAIENAEIKQNRKWERNDQTDNKKFQKVWERFDFEPGDKIIHKFPSAATDYDEITKGENADTEKKEIVKRYEKFKKCVKIAEEAEYNTGARFKIAQGKNDATKVQAEKSPKKSDYSKKKEKKEMKQTNIKEKVKGKSNNKKKIKEKSGKKEKNLRELKNEKEPKRSWFFTLCPGGKVEESTPIVDTLCDTCKLNLEFI